MRNNDMQTPENSSSESMRYNVLLPEETQPVVSMPSPSPSVLQQQTQDVRRHFEFMSLSLWMFWPRSRENLKNSFAGAEPSGSFKPILSEPLCGQH